MSTTKFTGSRGIKPLDKARVRLPGWELTMEIPGVPYSEPGFSSVRQLEVTSGEKATGVIGVAYLITWDQWISVIGSEGGGIAYSNMLVQVEPLSPEDEVKIGSRPFVWTLGTALSKQPPAWPSKRYMSIVWEDIIASGALEARLPAEYRNYLQSIPVYIPSKAWRGQLGATIFLGLWTPIMSLNEKLTKITLHKDGNAPVFVVGLVRLTMAIMWFSHDWLFAPLFGRGDGLERRESLGDLEEAAISLLIDKNGAL